MHAEAKRVLDNARSAQTNLSEANDADYSSLTHYIVDVDSVKQESGISYLRLKE